MPVAAGPIMAPYCNDAPRRVKMGWKSGTVAGRPRRHGPGGSVRPGRLVRRPERLPLGTIRDEMLVSLGFCPREPQSAAATARRPIEPD